MSGFDIERVKGAYRLENFIPGLKKVGRIYKMCCPFHTERTPSFVVNPETQQWRCYGACQTGGDVLAYAMKVNGWSFSEALNDLASRAGVKLERRVPKEDTANARTLGLLKEIAAFYHDVLLNSEAAIPAMEYLITTRGLSVGDIETWQLGYAPNGWQFSYSHLKNLGYTEHEMIEAGVLIRNDEGKTYDRFRHRIMFPIHDERGRVRGFSARAMPDAKSDDAKYINSPASKIFDKGALIYGGSSRVKNGHRAAQMPFQVSVIVEGQMDAICAHKWGFTNVYAQMGTSLTDAHLEMLKRSGSQTIVLCLDSDQAGQKAMRDRARKIILDKTAFRLGMDVKIASLGTFKDPDEMFQTSPTLWEDAIANARPVVDVLIDDEASTLAKDATVQQKIDTAKRVMSLLRVPDNAILTHDNARKLAVALSLPESSFVEWAGPQLVVLSKPAPAPLASPVEPSLETAILKGILKNVKQSWWRRANSALMCLAPMGTPLPFALAPLGPLDFTHDRYAHLMTAIVTHGDDCVEDALEGTPLETVYQRVKEGVLVPVVFAADAPEITEDSYEDFVRKVFRLRLNRLKEDMAIFNMMGDTKGFMEAMQGVALLQKRTSNHV